MRTLLLATMACLLGACTGHVSDGDHAASDGGVDVSEGGPDASDSEPPVIHTGEVCKVDGDCKMDPGVAFCRNALRNDAGGHSITAVRYEIATCGADQRCAWSRLEMECGFRCEDGYCITAVVR